MALKKRFVVVGAGSIGMRHARLLASRKDIVVELCDTDDGALDAAVRKLGVLPLHQSYDAMLQSKPDMILVASPHQWHVPQTLQALEAGIHVLCEKPMSNDLVTAKSVLEVGKHTDKIVSYGFSNHFNPGLVKIKEIIDSGQLGEVLYVHFHIGTYETLINSRSRYQESTEAALLMDYVHQPDLLYWILGKNPTGIYALGSTGGQLKLKSTPNAITLLMDYSGPLTTCIHLNYLQYPDRYHCEFIGDRGWVYLDLINNVLSHADAGQKSVKQHKIEFERDDIYRAEHQAFLDAVAGERPPESPPFEALQSMLVMEASIQSWKTGTRVSLGSIG